MTDRETPWIMPEISPAENEWFDEGPFASGTDGFDSTSRQDLLSPGEAWPESPFEAPIPAMESTGTFEGEGLTEVDVAGEVVAGCGGPVTGTPPLIFRGSTAVRSRNPWVGRAQSLLNVFLARRSAGVPTCSDQSSATAQYIAAKAARLTATAQNPLVADCKFGEGTETATLMFQACRGLVRDGKIGEKTWPHLLALEAPGPAPTPGPTPPGTQPTPTPGVRVRGDVWALSATSKWHPTLYWYARGVAALKRRDVPPYADPRCWRHLAETHGATLADRSWPPGAQWRKCEHFTWHFLPWHRAYLHHFEKIIRDEILRLGGPADWALPFWDYSDTRPGVRGLPPSFKETTWPDPGTNPLFEPRRGSDMNTTGILTEADVSTRQVFRESLFTPPPTSITAGFGGTRGPAGSHTGAAGAQRGALEDVPHGTVHSRIGGLMGGFGTAGQDPIFWLHHANIDRLWEAWRRHSTGNTNPTASDWLTATWTFGSGGTTTRIVTGDLLETPRLGYRYSDMPAVPTPELEGWAPGAEADHEEERPAELVGASGEVALGPDPSTVRVVLGAPAGPAAQPLREAAGVPTGVKVFLRLENITGTVVHSSGVVVYLNVPRGARATDFPDRQAGTVSMFGVVEASRRDASHSGSGIGATFDITRVARALAAAGQWDPASLDVSLVPILDSAGRVGAGDVKVGRVSVFYA